MTHGSFVCLWISMGTWHIFPALSLSFSLCLTGLMTWLTLEFIFIFLRQTIAFMFFIRKFPTKNFVFYLLVCGGLWNSWSDRNLYNVKFEFFFVYVLIHLVQINGSLEECFCMFFLLSNGASRMVSKNALCQARLKLANWSHEDINEMNLCH